jgi:undecaprenyl-diphosphatase
LQPIFKNIYANLLENSFKAKTCKLSSLPIIKIIFVYRMQICTILLFTLPEKIKALDYYIFSKINGKWHNTFFDTFFPFTRETFFWLPFYFFLVLFVIINFKRFGWLWVLFLVLNVVVSDQVSSTLIKDNFFRLRPCRDPAIAESVRFLVKSCGANSSFTSSHAANHFAAAMFIFATLRHRVSIKKWWALIFLWALIPCYAQIYVGVHFPVDILGGILLGIVLGYLMGYLFNRTVLKRQT